MYKLAAIAVALSAIMQGVALVLGKFAADVLPLAIIALLYLVFAYYLFKQKRIVAWLTFIAMLIGITGALTGLNSGSFAPNRVFNSIAILNIIAAACLFVVLWRSKTDNRINEAIEPTA